MTEYKIVCDIYRRTSKKLGGKDSMLIGVEPFCHGIAHNLVFLSFDRALQVMADVEKTIAKEEKKKNKSFREDDNSIFYEHRNFRVICRFVSEWTTASY